MNPVDGLRRTWHWSVRKILSLWVRVTIKPDDAPAVILAGRRPVCYVLERESQTDLAVLSTVCTRLGLPRPERRLLIGQRRADKAYFELIRPAGLFTTRHALRAPRYVPQLVAAAAADPEFDVDLVPVAIFWGRAPHKEASLWRLLFAEDWVWSDAFARLSNVLVNGRQYPGGFRRAAAAARCTAGRHERAAQCPLVAAQYSRQLARAACVGHRTGPVAPPHAGGAITQNRGRARCRAPRNAGAWYVAPRRAAHGPQARHRDRGKLLSVLRPLHVTALAWLWNRLYDGVDFEHVEKMNEIGDGAEIIYVRVIEATWTICCSRM